MKLNTLSIKGSNAAEYFYDFGNKAAGCIVLADADGKNLREALSYVFYGEAAAGRELPLTAELKFVIEDVEYSLARTTSADAEGAVTESAVLTGADGKTVCEGVEAVNAFIDEKVGLNKVCFEELFFIDRDEAANIYADTLTRESFIAEKMAKFATSEDVMAKYAALKDEERALLEHIDMVEAVTRDELKEQQLIVDSDKLALDDVRGRIESVKLDLGYAAKYQEELNAYYDAVAKMDALKARNDEMAALAERAARSTAASEVAAAYEKYDALKADIAAKKKALEADKKEKEALEAKAQSGENSLKLLGDEYVAAAERERGLNAAIHDLIVSGNETPQRTDILRGADAYYAKFDEESEELKARREVLENEAGELVTKLDELTKRKIAIRESSGYKQAVRDGAAAEARMAGITAEIKTIEERIERLSANRAALADDAKALKDNEKNRKNEVQKLEREIRGKYATVEEAVDAAILYKQTLYAKHLWVSRNEVELDAVKKKIEGVEGTKGTYADRLATLTTKREEVSRHRARLIEKLRLLNEKLTEYMSYNRLREIAGEVEYGGHCPLCDGFVSVKKELPLRDTKALDDQIKAVEAEIAKDNAAIVEAESSIGQYKAAETVSAQYLEALETTKKNKEQAIAKVLDEYGVKSIPELFALVEKAAKDGNELTRKVDNFRRAEGELTRLEEATALIAKQTDAIDNELLPAERNALQALRDEYADVKSAYDVNATYFGGESALSLADKLTVVEKEYEDIEDEISSDEARLSEVDGELNEINKRIADIEERKVKVEVNGVELTYGEIIVKVYTDYLIALEREAAEATAAKENVKLRIAGTRKVVNDVQAAAREAADKVALAEASIAATEETASNLYAEYEAKFAEIGITKREDLAVIIMSDEELDKSRETLYAYDEDVAGTKEAVNVYKAGIDAHAAYYDNYAANNAALESLKAEEDKAVMALGNSMAVMADMERRYNELIDCNRRLGYLQARIKGIDDMSAAIKEGAILATDLASLISARAQEIVKSVSGDRYATESGEDGALVLVTNGKGKIRYDKLTKEEAALMPFATAAAYNEVMVALLAGNILPAIIVKAEECDKQSLTPLVEYSKNRELIAIPEDDAAFFKAISKISV